MGWQIFFIIFFSAYLLMIERKIFLATANALFYISNIYKSFSYIYLQF